jgi:hypothetical protein
MKEVIETAKPHGIQVTGTVHRALQSIDAMYLEANNIAAYRSFRDRSLRHFDRVGIFGESHFPTMEDLKSIDVDWATLKLAREKVESSEFPDKEFLRLRLEN